MKLLGAVSLFQFFDAGYSDSGQSFIVSCPLVVGRYAIDFYWCRFQKVMSCFVISAKADIHFFNSGFRIKPALSVAEWVRNDMKNQLKLI